MWTGAVPRESESKREKEEEHLLFTKWGYSERLKGADAKALGDFASLLFTIYVSLPILGLRRSPGLTRPGIPKLGTGLSLREARWECS